MNNDEDIEWICYIYDDVIIYIDVFYLLTGIDENYFKSNLSIIS